MMSNELNQNGKTIDMSFCYEKTSDLRHHLAKVGSVLQDWIICMTMTFHVETSYYGVSTKPHVFEIIGEKAEIYITEIQQTITYSQSKEATDHSVASFLGFYYEII